jgi:nitrate/nitrite transport system ATP-binding protein
MITNSVEEAILLSDRIVPLSRGPKATLRPAVDVTLPRPRTPDTLAHSDETVRIQARVIDSLKHMNVPSAVLEVAV